MDKPSDKNKLDRKVPVLLSCRWIMAYTLLVCYSFVFSFRVNMSMAIVCMVNDTSTTNNTIEEECGILEEEADVVQGDFNWDKSMQGHVLSSFFYGYLLTQVPGGLLADMFGGKYVVFTGMCLSTAATLLTPLAAQLSVNLVIFLRVLIGIGTGVTFPAAQSMFGRWVPPLESTKIMSFAGAGISVGNILALSLSGVMCSSGLGWPLIFYTFGGGGVLWLCSWLYLVYNTPAEHPRISPAELDYITTSIGCRIRKNKDSFSNIPWVKMSTSVPFWAILITQVCNNWGSNTMLTNLPTYMKEVLRYDIKTNGALSALPYILQFLAAMLGGQAVDFVRGRGWLNTTHARKVFQCSGFIGQGIFIVAAGYVECSQRYLALVFLCLSVFCTYGNRAGFLVNHVDLAPRYAGIMYGITNTFGTIPGIVAPVAIAAMTPDGTREQWQRVFFTCGGFYMVACLVYGVFASGELQNWAHGRDVHEDITTGTGDFGHVNSIVTTSDEKASNVVAIGDTKGKYVHTADAVIRDVKL